MKFLMFVIMLLLCSSVVYADIQCVPSDGEPSFPNGVIFCVDEFCQGFATYSSEEIPYGWRLVFVDRQGVGLHFQDESIDWNSLTWIEIDWEVPQLKRSATIDLTPYVDFCDKVVENESISLVGFKYLYR